MLSLTNIKLLYACFSECTQGIVWPLSWSLVISWPCCQCIFLKSDIISYTKSWRLCVFSFLYSTPCLSSIYIANGKVKSIRFSIDDTLLFYVSNIILTSKLFRVNVRRTQPWKLPSEVLEQRNTAQLFRDRAWFRRNVGVSH